MQRNSSDVNRWKDKIHIQHNNDVLMGVKKKLITYLERDSLKSTAPKLLTKNTGEKKTGEASTCILADWMNWNDFKNLTAKVSVD